MQLFGVKINFFFQFADGRSGVLSNLKSLYIYSPPYLGSLLCVQHLVSVHSVLLACWGHRTHPAPWRQSEIVWRMPLIL